MKYECTLCEFEVESETPPKTLRGYGWVHANVKFLPRGDPEFRFLPVAQAEYHVCHKCIARQVEKAIAEVVV